MKHVLDCLVIGGGPAGLTAAIYLARFHLRVALIHSGQSRAALIPRSMNHAGYPGGIRGAELVARMHEQALSFGTRISEGLVQQLTKTETGFVAHGDFENIQARSILMATGVSDRRPSIDEALHAEALTSGHLRYCPICDGYEITDRNIAIYGAGDHGVREATFLRSFTARVSLLLPSASDHLDTAQLQRLDQFGIRLVKGPVDGFQLADDGISVAAGADRLRFEVIYPALGSGIHSDLAAGLGAKRAQDGSLLVDAHQRTSIAGLYAAGDVVLGLNQISQAMGEAGVAATAIRNDLAVQTPLLR